MSRKTFPIAIMLGLLLPLMAMGVAAQTSQELVAIVPFDFTVCRQLLPAGKYKLRPISSGDPSVLLVRGEDNRQVEVACTHDVRSQTRAATGKLIFNRYGHQYFLSEMWLPGELSGRQLVKSEKEEALLKELRGIRKHEKVTIKVTEVKP